MAVTVSPEQFTFVLVRRGRHRGLRASPCSTRLGMDDRSLHIEVDETTPIARVQSEIGRPDRGRAPRAAPSRTPAAPPAVGDRGQHRARPHPPARAGPAVAAGSTRRPPTRADLAQVAAWDTYSVGRLARLGYPVHQPRWLYNFRNRHGFTDQADDVASPRSGRPTACRGRSCRPCPTAPPTRRRRSEPDRPSLTADGRRDRADPAPRAAVNGVELDVLEAGDPARRRSSSSHGFPEIGVVVAPPAPAARRRRLPRHRPRPARLRRLQLPDRGRRRTASTRCATTCSACSTRPATTRPCSSATTGAR